MIYYWAINRTDPQNLLSTTLDVPLQLGLVILSDCSNNQHRNFITKSYQNTLGTSFQGCRSF